MSFDNLIYTSGWIPIFQPHHPSLTRQTNLCSVRFHMWLTCWFGSCYKNTEQIGWSSPSVNIFFCCWVKRLCLVSLFFCWFELVIVFLSLLKLADLYYYTVYIIFIFFKYSSRIVACVFWFDSVLHSKRSRIKQKIM